MKAYKLYRNIGKSVVLTFVELNDELMDEIEIEPAEGFEILRDLYNAPYIQEIKTQIPYDIAMADIDDNGLITAPELRVKWNGTTEETGKTKVIAKIVG